LCKEYLRIEILPLNKHRTIITKGKLVVLHWEINAVSYEDHTDQVTSLCGKVEVVNV